MKGLKMKERIEQKLEERIEMILNKNVENPPPLFAAKILSAIIDASQHLLRDAETFLPRTIVMKLCACCGENERR